MKSVKFILRNHILKYHEFLINLYLTIFSMYQ